MNIKSILLGASAAALAATGAQAADLPVAPEPVDYVRVCDAFGTGFFYIPGTETCLKIGGGVRAEFRMFDVLDNGGSNWDDRTDTSTGMRARGYINFDSRTNTEYGLLRTYVAAYITVDNNGAAGTTLDEAFIQLGGFVAGRTGSYFDFYTGDNWGSVLDQGFADNGDVNLFAYTFQFGNGFSASASVEAGDDRRSQIFYNGNQIVTAATATALQANSDGYGGHKVPDFVANLRVDQGWGSAQLMGALHHVYGRSYAAGVANAPVPAAGLAGKGKLGWAIGAGATFNLPMLAAGDSFSIQASYAQGAIQYVNSGWGAFSDASYNTVGGLKLSNAWGIGAGFTHFWTPAISTSLTASYSDLDQALTVGGDFREINVQGNVGWRPVSGLLVGAELEYRNRDFSGATPNDDALVGILRVQRTF
ncbi:porin [Stappia taiwanensis]|uniref:Porin n=1 Tax=Stappia taiwanensis TaxID=992267 RepID=A0A838XTM3_9HYPH|nr:porin [Stappia taiwanensis]MBA4613785.1 porin [Stappia taiwanensis]GGE90795.1 porin [Stappia taiwanensis]